MRRRALTLALLAMVLAACSGSSLGGKETIVASIYPLAFAAERMVPGAEVIDLTPSGIEAHDLELTLEQRSEIQSANVVLYLGEIGFQPQVERAVQEAEGGVVDLSGALRRHAGSVDPHAWLEPSSFIRLVFAIAAQLCPGDDCSEEQGVRMEAFVGELDELHETYTQELGNCRYRTLVVPHEAFGYLELYGFEQVGLSGLTPEAEPTAERLAEARALIDGGEAGAVFYEEHAEAKETAETFAEDAGVPALPLSTLESRPVEGDYFTVMEDNLESLREGLQCQ